MRFRSLFLPSILVLALGLRPAIAQSGSPSTLIGRVDGNQYIAPSGAFRVTVPVLGALGGSITDTENVVTFQDAFSTHQSIACFKMDATQRFEDEARGRKDYLGWFFSNYVQQDFENRFPGARIESALFIGDLQGGAVLVYNLLPGGSMFASRAPAQANGEPAVAKRGNLVFVNNGCIYVLSIELTEKVLEGTAFNKTVSEEDNILRRRVLDLYRKITFLDAEAAKKSDAADPSARANPAPTPEAKPQS